MYNVNQLVDFNFYNILEITINLKKLKRKLNKFRLVHILSI